VNLSRSREDLEAARLLAGAGHGRQAISRAYFAAFYAAEEALGLLGETRSKHAGVIAAFGQLIVRRGEIAESSGRLLRSLFERRSEVDYTEVEVPTEEVESAIRDATKFVEAVERWGQHRQGG